MRRTLAIVHGSHAYCERLSHASVAGLTARNEPDGVAIARLMAALDAPSGATEMAS